MPPTLNATSMFRYGLILTVIGVLSGLALDDLLVWISDYLGPGSRDSYAAILLITEVADMLLMPFGVGLTVGAFIVRTLERQPVNTP